MLLVQAADDDDEGDDDDNDVGDVSAFVKKHKSVAKKSGATAAKPKAKK